MAPYKTKRSFYTVILFLVSFVLTSCNTNSKLDYTIAETVNQVKVKYAPDRRLAVFDITWRRDGKSIVLRGEVDAQQAKEELLAQVRDASGLEVIDSVNVLPEMKLGNNTYGIVRVSVANLRSEPEHSAELTSQALMGTVVRILKTNRGWTYCQLPDKYIGWMENGSFVSGDKDFMEKWNNAQKVIVTQLFGLITSKPRVDAEPVSDVVIGMTLKCVARQDKWRKVQLPDDREGYIQTDLVEDYGKWKASRQATTESITRTARRFNGIPYLWGGTSSKGLDCSGFTKTVYWLNGVELPRDANQQAALGEDVDPGHNFENLRKGDLLFFGRKAEHDKPERVTHVGIYLGEKKFIHCSTLVNIESLDPTRQDFDQYRYDTFIRAKRIVKE